MMSTSEGRCDLSGIDECSIVDKRPKISAES